MGESAVTFGVREALSGLSDGLVAQIVLVTVSAAAGLAVYTAAVLAMRVGEAHQITGVLREQLARLRS